LKWVEVGKYGLTHEKNKALMRMKMLTKGV